MKKNTIDCLLINPYLPQGGNSGWSDRGEHIFDESDLLDHLGLAYLTASLRKNGFKVDLIDADLQKIPNEALILKIKHKKIKAIGVSVCHETYSCSVELCNLIKDARPDIKIIVGGPLIRMYGEESKQLFNRADFIVAGEGELILNKIIKEYLNDNTSNSAPRYFNGNVLKNLDYVPHPSRDNVNYLYKKQIEKGQPKALHILTSRGCEGKCIFCNLSDYINKEELGWRPRSAENIVNEIEYLISDYNPECIYIIDDSFICGQKGQERAKKIAKTMKNRNIKINFAFSCRANEINENTIAMLKEVGLFHVSFGVETIEPDSLLKLNKNQKLEDYLSALNILSKYQLSITVYMMIYHPFTNLNEIYLNYQFLKKIGAFNKINSNRTVFSMLFQNKTVVRKFSRMEKLLETFKLIEDNKNNKDFPLICNYSFQDKNVEKFIHDIWDKARDDKFENLLSIFESSLKNYGY